MFIMYPYLYSSTHIHICTVHICALHVFDANHTLSIPLFVVTPKMYIHMTVLGVHLLVDI